MKRIVLTTTIESLGRNTVTGHTDFTLLLHQEIKPAIPAVIELYPSKKGSYLITFGGRAVSPKTYNRARTSFNKLLDALNF